ncbi:D-beta-hydroxybutyrate permease [Klebsiella pneumoniae]|uniref:D-beta-hydroxybutyrate permease n=1 Tax=Klebsiella pneumoniae TaxID=573 RepID=A0A2X3GNA0_KLEPN|nr:D-beta-hydroxybutyrate permease [Klebsiella pneumoniae]
MRVRRRDECDNSPGRAGVTDAGSLPWIQRDPLCADRRLGAVLLTDPGAVGPAFTGLFMEKMVGFVKLYFPVFLWRGIRKLIELSGFSRSIVAAAIRNPWAPPRDPGDRAGVRPADLRRWCRCLWWPLRLPFRRRTISPERDPKRLIPATVALGAFSFTMDALPARRRSRILFPPASSAPTPGRPPGWGLSARCSLSSSVCCGWSVSAAKRRPAAKAMGPTCKMSRRPRMTSICRIR